MRIDLRHALPYVLSALAIVSIPKAATGSTFTILHNFCTQSGCPDGEFPNAGLLADSSGNLYGTATGGGAHQNGVIYELVKSGTTFTYHVLYSFSACNSTACVDGTTPLDRLIIDTSGNLYGTTVAGGTASGTTTSGGTVFKFLTAHKIYRVLYSFCSLGGNKCTDGGSPSSPLAYAGQTSGTPYDGKSALFGTTDLGGANGEGVLYQLTRSNTAIVQTVIHSFCSRTGCSDGDSPEGPIAVNTAGTVFGAAEFGGKLKGGAIYRAVPATGRESVLYSFPPCGAPPCTDGSAPQGVLLQSNTISGSTFSGGQKGSGVIYSFDVPSATEQVLYDFCAQPNCADGENPDEVLNPMAANLLGTAESGTGGVLFRLNTNKKTERILHTFCQQLPDCTDGEAPLGGAIADASGNMFGVTEVGGSGGGGIVYELSP